MKMRKLVAGMLTLALGMSAGSPALAAGAADARLTKVAQKVVATLAVPEDYTQFYGEPSETPLGTRWELSWSAESKGMNVSATDEGKVLSLYTWENEPYVAPARNAGTFGPSFPEMTRAQARTYAEAFLERVLTEGESAHFGDDESDTLSATQYNFNGSILLNGESSPMTFSLRVRLRDGAVVSFRRGDTSEYVGPIAAPDTVTTTEKAGALLKGTIDMKLEYVLAETKEGEAKRAVLRYLPVYGDDYYVDAATGKLVNLTELRRNLQGDYGALRGGVKAVATNDAAEAEKFATSGRALTEVELAGVAKLEGVLDQEGLEKAAKAWAELALEGYAIANVNYSVDRETGAVTARVVFAKNTEEGVYRRTVTVDAKTGELQSMYSSNPWTETEGEVKLTAAQAQEKARAFLTKLWGGQLTKTEVYDSSEAQSGREVFGFTFSQKVNGYFFPDNSISVTVDPVDGSIRGFSKSFDDTVTFDSAEGIVSLDTAIAAWAATYPVDFGYVEVPVKLDLNEQPVLYKALVDAGYSYYNTLKAGYAYGDREGWYLGVDAKTGEPVKGQGYTEPGKITYDDISGHWAEAVLTELARYNVGWFGGKADPGGALTQQDYLVLLLSADGYRYDDLSQKETLDDLYRTAYRRGLLTEEERNETKVLNRAEMVKMLLNSLGYGPVAQLKGIFKVDFKDAVSIAEADLGYAALAQGLGLVQGDNAGNYAPARSAARAEAAMMLWRYMKR